MTDERIRQNAEEYASKVAPAKSHKTGIPSAINHAVIRAFIDGAKYAYEHPKSPWISIYERLPDIGQKVITITNKGKLLLVARTIQPPYKEEGSWRWEHYIGKVTHWMLILELKKDEK